MKQTDLNRLLVFAAVVEAGGFTAAAERLGMVKSQVSQQVSRLEAELGVALLARSTRRVVATEAGETLYAESAPLLAGLQSVLEKLGDGARIEGRLRLTAPTDYAANVLGPWLAEFAALHPALEVELIGSDVVLDLVGEGIDLAIRHGALRDSSLRAVKLGSFNVIPVASPALLARIGPIGEPAQLNGQPWVALTALSAPLTWLFSAQDGRSETIKARAAMRVNSATVARQCACAGVGCAVLPDYMIADELASGRLQQLLPDWQLPAGGIYAVYPAARHLPAKVRALIDMLRVRIAAEQ